MLVKFNGVQKVQTRTGCPVCGNRRHQSSVAFERTTRFVLPNGQVKLFTIGNTYEVSSDTFDFLIDYTYSLNGNSIHPFEKV